MLKPLNRPKITDWHIDALIIVALMMSAWHVSDRLDNWLDLHLDDETFYLGHGADFPKVKLQTASWGPLYSLWYWAVAHIFALKPLKLYLMSQRLLILLLPTLIYVTMRSFSVRRTVALLIAWLFAISNLNVATAPKVGHLAAAVLLATIFLSNLLRSSDVKRWCCLTTGFLAASYVRPEFFLAFAIALMVLIYHEFRSRREAVFRWRSLWVPSVTMAVMFTAFAIKGLPVGSRSFAAFSQHFSLNWTERNPDAKLNGWTDDDVIISKNFGVVNSLTGALIANPGAVAFHVAQNACSLVPELATQTLTHFPIFTASTHWKRWAESVIILGLLVFTGAFSSPRQIARNVVANAADLSVLVPPLAAALAAALVIHPDSHYLITVAACIPVFACGLMADLPPRAECSPSPLLRPLGVSILLALVTPSYVGKAFPLPEYTSIRHLKSLHYQGDAVLLATNGSGHHLIGRNWKSLSAWNKPREEGFLSFIRRHNVNFIVVNQRMREDSRYRDDSDWLRFQADPTIAEFSESFPDKTDSGARIFIRKDVAIAISPSQKQSR